MKRKGKKPSNGMHKMPGGKMMSEKEMIKMKRKMGKKG